MRQDCSGRPRAAGEYTGGLRMSPPPASIDTAPAPAHSSAVLPLLLQALRPEQWLKNLLVFLPMLAGHHFRDGEAWANATLCFAVFSLGASGQYLINDVADLRWDRLNPRKRWRPLASGRLGTAAAMATAPVLVCMSLGGAWLLPEGVFAILLGYHAGALAYTFALKRAAVLDVVALASMYGLRVFAGGAAVQIWPSPWLIAFALFLFLSLALLKRVVELPGAGEAAPGRGFGADDRTYLLVLGVKQREGICHRLFLITCSLTEAFLTPILWGF